MTVVTHQQVKLHPFVLMFRVTVARLMGMKTNEVCSISGEVLNAVGEAIIQGLNAVLTAVLQSGTIPSNWMRGLVIPIWKRKWDRKDCNIY